MGKKEVVQNPACTPTSDYNTYTAVSAPAEKQISLKDAYDTIMTLMNSLGITDDGKLKYAVYSAIYLESGTSTGFKTYESNYSGVDLSKSWGGSKAYFETSKNFFCLKNDSNGLTLNTDWGITVINLSEYCEKVENNEYPVLSIMITLCDAKSTYNNKTANECSSDELIFEVYRQLKIYYINCENNIVYDYFAVINPNNYYDNDKKIWKCTDNAYYNTLNERYIEFKSKTIDNLYTLGTHNGRSYIPFNSIESAISNALCLESTSPWAVDISNLMRSQL